MDAAEEVSRLDVLRYELEVEFSKLPAAPFDPWQRDDLLNLIEELPKYHDAPRNSPAHLYAALADDRLVWRRLDVPVARIIIGPGDCELHCRVSTEAEGFMARFVDIVRTRYALDECFRSYFRQDEIRYPVVPCTLRRHRDATPWLPEHRTDHGHVYRLQDGYHRTFRMICDGATTVPALVASFSDGSAWSGYYGHLLRWEDGRWIPRPSAQ